MENIVKDRQFYKFCFYGFLKNLRFFDAFFLLFLLDKGISFSQIGILYAVREIIINLLEIPSGIFADTFGRKSSLMGSFLVYIISFIIFFLSANFWLFLVAFVLYGIGDAFRSGTHKGMIMDYLELQKRSFSKIEYYGHTRACSQKGSAISSLIAGMIIYFGGEYKSIFLYSSIPYIINFFLVMTYPKDINNSIKENKSRTKLTIAEFWRIIKKPIVLQKINTMALHSAFLKAIKDYIQPIMISVAAMIPIFLDVDIKRKNGIIIGLIYFIIYILTSRASQLASKVERLNKGKSPYYTLLIGFVLGLIIGVSFYYKIWIISLIAFMGVYIIENVRKPILTGYISDTVPNKILTSVISAQSLLKTVMTSIIAISLGFLADNNGIGFALAIISGILFLLTILFNFRYKISN